MRLRSLTVLTTAAFACSRTGGARQETRESAPRAAQQPLAAEANSPRLPGGLPRPAPLTACPAGSRLTKLGNDVRVTNTDQASELPVIVAAGSEFVIAWRETSPLMVQRMSADGALLGSAVNVATPTYSGHRPGVAWSGSELAVSWAAPSGSGAVVRTQRLLPTGAPVSGPIDVGTVTTPFLSGLAVAWNAQRGTFGTSWITPSGASLLPGPGVTRTVTSETVHGLALAAGPGGDYAIAWNGPPGDVNLTRFDAQGVRLGESRIGSGSSGRLAWTGSEYGLLYTCAPGACFARASAQGAIVGTQQVVNSVQSWPTGSTWTGDGWIVAWQQGRPEPEGVFVRQLGVDGAPVADPVAVKTSYHGKELPSIAWLAPTLGVVWSDNRDGNWEIYFARLRCS